MLELIIILTTVTLLILAMVALLAVASLDLIGYISTDVPFIPIQKNVVEKIVSLSPVKDGVFYDLGSGEGRVVVAMAQAYPAMQSVGVEKAPLPRIITMLTRGKRPKNASFIFKDINDVSLSDASYVYVYLLTKITHGLEPKFERELKKGARLVSCDFPLKNREPNETHVVEKRGSKHTLYVYDF